MLTVLLKLRPFCEKWALQQRFTNLYLSDEDWEKISEIQETLEPSKKATTKLQRENLTLTDIYKIWEQYHMDTANLGTVTK